MIYIVYASSEFFCPTCPTAKPLLVARLRNRVLAHNYQMKYTNSNVWNNNAKASTDCLCECLFCPQYFKNRGQKDSLSKFSKFQNNSRIRPKKWPFSRIIQLPKNSTTIQGILEPVATLLIEEYWEPSQTSMVKVFVKIVNTSKPLTIFAK